MSVSSLNTYKVVKPYERPYKNPIAVSAGEKVTLDFDKPTDIMGWIWCTAKDGRSGWTPIQWLTQSNGIWRINREFNAIELTVVPGEILEVAFEESGFFGPGKKTVRLAGFLASTFQLLIEPDKILL